MHILNKIILALIILSFNGALQARTIKKVEVSGSTPYVDHVSLAEGSTDMDLLVKIAFDEPNNSLIVSLISYRKLFVFQNDVSYSQAVGCSELRPDKLPYVVESDEQAIYCLTKPLKKSIVPKRKHVFHRWIEYEGLQLQPTDYKMVNDYIEQRFDVLHKEADVSVTLRDVLVMEEQAARKKVRYELFFQTDLDRRYEISIKRDPCFGKEEAIAAAVAQTEGIKTAFEAFDQKFGKASSFSTPESDKLFNEMKALLLKQFPQRDEVSTCPDIQANIDRYNCYVDSIRNMQSKYAIKVQARKRAAAVLDLSADHILQAARKIDDNVNRWLLSSDKMERRDLENACYHAIDQVQSRVNQATEINESQHAALNIFYEAENYFRRTCVKE